MVYVYTSFEVLIMGQYSKDEVKVAPMLPKLVKFEKRQIKEVLAIHWNFSEFVRDAVNEKITKEQAILKEVGL